MNRILSKINYKIHTDAIKLTLIPENVSKVHQGMTYATEADLLNVALFGMTAKEWRSENPDLDGNHRDHATLHQLIVLANIESLNAEYIKEGLSQQERLIKLNRIAIGQLHSLLDNLSVKKLESLK